MLDRFFSRWQRTGWRGAPLAAVLAVFAVLIMIWPRPDPAPRVAAQEATSQEAPGPASPPAESPPPALDDLESFLGDASASVPAEERPGGIPGLGAVEVTGNLKHLVAGGGFPCDGPSPDGDLVLWSCVHPSGGYAVEVVGDDPLTVYSVTATVGEVPERDTEVFFSRVLDLSLEDSAALDAGAWVSGSVPSGGRTFSGDVEVTIYGDGASRAMSVVSSDAFLD